MFQSDGIIVTGTATGEPTDMNEMKSKKKFSCCQTEQAFLCNNLESE